MFSRTRLEYRIMHLVRAVELLQSKKSLDDENYDCVPWFKECGVRNDKICTLKLKCLKKCLRSLCIVTTKVARSSYDIFSCRSNEKYWYIIILISVHFEIKANPWLNVKDINTMTPLFSTKLWRINSNNNLWHYSYR